MAISAAQKITESLRKKFGKEFGNDCVDFFGNKEIQNIPRMKTQCVVLDSVTGGGWPLGRIVELFGGESSGKTTVCYHAMAEAQRLFPDTAVGFIDSEYSFDPVYAQACGVDVNQLVISQPKDGQEAFTIIEGMIDEGIKVVIVDSVAAMVPRKEAEGDYGDSPIGQMGQMMSQGMRKLTSVIGRAQALVIFTNQTRDKIGVMYGDPECVSPDTKITINDELMTMETMFAKAGFDWKSLEKNQVIDISNKGFKIRSFNHETNQVEDKKVLSIIRKDDSVKYKLFSLEGYFLLSCSGAHRIWDCKKNEYVHVQDIETGTAFTKYGNEIEFGVVKTNEVTPILDLEVEGNANYFTNGILSHNTTPGGKALKFYASIRLKLTKLTAISEGDAKTAIRVRAEAVKNKTAPPYKRGEYVIRFGTGIDNEGLYFTEIIDRGLIRSEGNGIFYVGDVKIRGKEKVRVWLEEHPDIYDELKKRVDAGEVVKKNSEPEEPVTEAEPSSEKEEEGEV